MLRKVKVKKSIPLDYPKTAIIATIGGPDIYSKRYIKNLVKEGMTIARINLAHVEEHKDENSLSYKHIKRIIKDIEDISNKEKQPIAILFDICGPKIRVGNLNEPIKIHKGDNRGDSITFTTNTTPGDGSDGKCPVTYSGFVDDIKENDRIFLDDGKIKMKMLDKDIANSHIFCEIVSSSEGFIKKNKGFNLPDTLVSEESITEKDIEILQMLPRLGIVKYIDFLAQSFVRASSDITTLRTIMRDFLKRKGDVGRQKGPIQISKIETYQAVKVDESGKYTELDQIVSKSDGIMVARGDLAVETSPEDVPLIQQYLTQRGIEQGNPVIVATQMLLSMTERGHKRPTRPEANDVANAVLNYSDAIMLSEETATGANPGLCVKTMKDIALKAENSQKNERAFLKYCNLLKNEDQITDVEENIKRQQAIAESAIILANNLKSPAIAVSTASGDTAMKISRYRPQQSIIAITDIESSARKMLLYRGIYPFLVEDKPYTFEEIIEGARAILKDIIVKGKKLIPESKEKIYIPLTLGIEPSIKLSAATPGNTNTIYILEFN